MQRGGTPVFAVGRDLPVILMDTSDALVGAAAAIARATVLALDAEWRPVERRAGRGGAPQRIALLQVAAEERQESSEGGGPAGIETTTITVFLLDLLRLEHADVCAALKPALRNPDVAKVRRMKMKAFEGGPSHEVLATGGFGRPAARQGC